MKKLGNQLIFTSQINRDGSGTTKITENYLKFLDKEYFTVKCLSMTEKTFVAHGFNSFVVRLKDKN